MRLSEHGQRNRIAWDGRSDEYQAAHAVQLNTFECAWGTFSIPEDEVHALGDVAGKEILELGCGPAQWSIGLVRCKSRIHSPYTTTYEFAPLVWARRWPAEHIWKVRKTPANDRARDWSTLGHLATSMGVRERAQRDLCFVLR